MADRTTALRSDELPKYVVHADWSGGSDKRWMTVATLGDDGFQVAAPVPVDAVGDLIGDFRRRAGSRSVVLGFDFPIGVPQEYAKKAGISNFPDALLEFGQGVWRRFYDIADTFGDVSIHRPFYPRTASRPGHNQAQFANALGVAWDDLLRRCDRATGQRGDACRMFWLVGANQVGRAAISGWRDVLVPAMQHNRSEIGLWPFDGEIACLVRERGCVVVETYPAEACVQLGLPAPGRGWKKGDQSHRARHATAFVDWAARRPQIRLSSTLQDTLRNGFGAELNGDDRFDAFVGLLGVLNVVLAEADGAPEDDSTRKIEGWMCGQNASGSQHPAAGDRPISRPHQPMKPIDSLSTTKVTLDHIGIAVADLTAALRFYRDALGLEVDSPEEVASERVRAHFIPAGACALELLEATTADSPIAKYLETRGPGLHHITLRVDDIEAALARLKARGVRLIDERPRQGGHGSLVAFIHPSAAHGVLVELKQVLGP